MKSRGNLDETKDDLKIAKIVSEYKSDVAGIVFEHLESGSFLKKIFFSPVKLIVRLALRKSGKKIKKDNKPSLNTNILVRTIKLIEKLHKENPTFFAQRIKINMPVRIEQVDYSELADMVYNSSEDIIEISKAVSDVMYNYPGKQINMLSIFPAVINISIGVLKNISGQINKMSPDGIAQLLLSLLSLIDGKSLGSLINEINENARKIHTGSALLGEPGFPEFQVVLAKLFKDVFAGIDGALFWKAALLRAEGRSSYKGALIDLMKDNTDFTLESIKRYAALKNINIGLRRQKLELMDSLPEEETAKALEQSLSDLSAFDMAETVNLVCNIINRVREIKPEMASWVLSEFVNTLDLDEIRDCIKWALQDAAEPLKPVARAVVPEIIKTLCRWLGPETDGNDGAIEEARNEFRRVFLEGEANK